LIKSFNKKIIVFILNYRVNRNKENNILKIFYGKSGPPSSRFVHPEHDRTNGLMSFKWRSHAALY